MNTEEKCMIAVAVGVVLLMVSLIYVSVSVNARFCDRYFPDTPTFDCVMSSRYKYDGDK